jgi:hypothetical protein
MDLYESRVIEHAIGKIAEEADFRMRLLVSSPSIDFAGYQNRVGSIKGLHQAIAIIQQLKKDYGRADDAVENRPTLIAYEE